MKSLDLTGQKFNYLTVLERDYEYQKEKNSNKVYWKCQCKCGNIAHVITNHLTSGKVKSCGCYKKEIIHNNHSHKLLGQRFGRLLVIEETNKRKYGDIVWKCKCDCGNIKEIMTRNLTSGNTVSCGCYHNELWKKQITNNKIGKTYGKLTVLEKTNKTVAGGWIWKCKCECGNIVEVSSASLQSGHTISCGCVKSKGEEQISQILNQNQISFEKQKTFNTCIFPKTNAPLFFDFYVDNKFLLEYDGIQHFEAIGGWNTEEKVQQTQLRDNYKNQWAKENNIPLKRIPYWKLNDLTIEDIMGNKFLIT